MALPLMLGGFRLLPGDAFEERLKVGRPVENSPSQANAGD
jgi:hypothetical protein